MPLFLYYNEKEKILITESVFLLILCYFVSFLWCVYQKIEILPFKSTIHTYVKFLIKKVICIKINNTHNKKFNKHHCKPRDPSL